MEIHEYFTYVDWLVVFGYLALTTWVGHAMRGKQGTIKDFFLGGRSIPWPAVSGSIIATEISGVTFIGVPGTLFALHGDFTYLQWAIGSIIARVIVAGFFVRLYYQREIYSPYDFMGLRLGLSVKTLATIFFTIGSILAQSVRVLVAAIPLKVVTGMPLWVCIVIIGLFAIGWTLMGGMRTVIWTDVMQFALFLLGGVIALIWLIGGIEGGWSAMMETAEQFGRTRILNPEFGLGADLQFTLWVALFAVPFQNLAVFGVDQLAAQRMFCCKNARAAGKAILFSSLGQLVTLLMLLIGAALFVDKHQSGFGDQELATVFATGVENVQDIRDAATFAEHPGIHPLNEVERRSDVIVPGSVKISDDKSFSGNSDYIFPIWIVLALPVGLSGLILAGVFAAAISSLDSILAALSQTTLSLFYHPERGDVRLSEQQLMSRSRLLVVGWGVALTAFTLLLAVAREDAILPLAFGMTTYTVGPLLAFFLCAMIGRGSFRGLLIGSLISFLAVMFVRTDIWGLLIKAGVISAESLATLFTYELNASGDGVRSVYCFAWMWPLTCFITLGVGLLVPAGKGGVQRIPSSH
jgi:Na+/proline symporter